MQLRQLCISLFYEGLYDDVDGFYLLNSIHPATVNLPGKVTPMIWNETLTPNIHKYIKLIIVWDSHLCALHFVVILANVKLSASSMSFARCMLGTSFIRKSSSLSKSIYTTYCEQLIDAKRHCTSSHKTCASIKHELFCHFFCKRCTHHDSNKIVLLP